MELTHGGAEPSRPAFPGHRPRRSRTPRATFFAQPVEHHSTLGIDPAGLISVGFIFGTGRIFPLALNFFDTSYHGVH
jgi:hypothetical protein